MLRVAVCDDEPEITKELAAMVRERLPECETVCCFSGGALLERGPFDIIFLDIKMERMNGIETAKRLRSLNDEAIIIFITSAKEYVFEAFDVMAFHYLLKPVNELKLEEVLTRAVNEARRKAVKENKRLFIKTKGRGFTVNFDDILFVESAGRKLLLHTERGTVCFYGTMTKLEKQLGDGFYRSHRGYLVNLSVVAEYDAENIFFANGERAYLSKEKYPDFVKRYMRFLRNGGNCGV